MLNRNEAAEVQLDVVSKSSQKVSWVLATPGKRKGVSSYEEAPVDGFKDVKDFLSRNRFRRCGRSWKNGSRSSTQR